MASRTLFNRIALSARPFAQQSRGVKYTTQFALDRKGVKDHAHHTAGTDLIKIRQMLILDLWRKVTV